MGAQYLLSLILVCGTVVCGQLTSGLPLQLAGCRYKLVPELESCPRTEDGQQTTEITNVLQMISLQSITLIQQQMSLQTYQQQLDALSRTVERLTTGQEGSTDDLRENITRLEQQVKGLQGLVVDLEGSDGCSRLLVSGESPIPDSAITASSSWDGNHGTDKSRIYTATSPGCWAAKVNDHNQWIKFDFGQLKTVTAIITKGRHSDTHQFVRRYKMYYSVDGTSWTVYTDDRGGDKMFRGNFDAETVRKNQLEPHVTARYVRINPATWFGHISMRIDFLGCGV